VQTLALQFKCFEMRTQPITLLKKFNSILKLTRIHKSPAFLIEVPGFFISKSLLAHHSFRSRVPVMWAVWCRECHA
jgi:hypothetical protein